MNASNYKEWEAAGLKDFGDFADCVTYCNQSEYGDGALEGEWYYFDEDTGILYYGTFGNYNSAGASHYTYAETDTLEAEAMLQKFQAAPEYIEEEPAEDAEPTEPQEGDATLAYGGCLACEGEVIGTYTEYEEAVTALRQWAEANNYSPTLWVDNGGGNWAVHTY